MQRDTMLGVLSVETYPWCRWQSCSRNSSRHREQQQEGISTTFTSSKPGQKTRIAPCNGTGANVLISKGWPHHSYSHYSNNPHPQPQLQPHTHLVYMMVEMSSGLGATGCRGRV
jgi:hypothetical protein